MKTSTTAANPASNSALTSVSTKLINSIGRRLNRLNAELIRIVSFAPAPQQKQRTERTAKPPLPKPVSVRTSKTESSTRLNDSEKHDIKLLLTQTTIPVSVIAKMFEKSRPTIYNLRDKLELNVHRGSAALIAGARRVHAKVTSPVEEASQTAVA